MGVVSGKSIENPDSVSLIHKLTRKKKRKCRKSGRVVVVVVVKGLYPCDGGIWLDMRMLFKR